MLEKYLLEKWITVGINMAQTYDGSICFLNLHNCAKVISEAWFDFLCLPRLVIYGIIICKQPLSVRHGIMKIRTDVLLYILLLN